MNNNTFDRRNFLKLSSAAIGGIALNAGLTGVLASPVRKVGEKKTIKLGFVGLGGRGSYHLSAALGIPDVEVKALCEIVPDRLEQAKKWVLEYGQPAPNLYGRGPMDYVRLCEEEDLDAVICATPWDSHSAICLAAMRNDKHAACEVPLVQTLEEAWELVETHEKTGKWASIVIGGFGDLTLLNMVRNDLLGDILHLESGYIHDLRKVKFDPEGEPWRLAYTAIRNGNLYPDHPMRNMMPILNINHGDRFDYLVSMSTKSVMINQYAAAKFGPDSEYATKKLTLGDYNATLIRTTNGKLITLNHDTHTPHPREDFRVQGTKGVYVRDKSRSRIYLDEVSPESHEWESPDKYLEKFAHPIDLNYKPAPRRSGPIRGHGQQSSTTPINWHRLVLALQEEKMPDWDVYDSVTSSAIIPLTELSVNNKSKPVDFPDFTKGNWKTRKPIYS